MILLFLAFIALAVLANAWKSDLRVRDVQVKGNNIVASKDILQLAAVPKNEHLFGLDLFAVQNRVLQNSFIRSVAVLRNAPHCVTIEVEERIPVAVVACDRVMYLDADGVVLPPLCSQNIFDLPVISGSFSVSELKPGSETNNPRLRTALRFLALSREIGEDLSMQISEVRVDTDNNVTFYTAESGVPVITGHEGFGRKLVTFEGFWRTLVRRHGAHELQYIDLRFDEQVVVRWNHDKEEFQS